MKQIFAIPAAAAATPPKPRKAANNATTKNTQVYQSMCVFPFRLFRSTNETSLRRIGISLPFPRKINTLAHAPEPCRFDLPVLKSNAVLKFTGGASDLRNYGCPVETRASSQPTN